VSIAIPPLPVPLPDIAVDATHQSAVSPELTDLIEAAQRAVQPFLAQPGQLGAMPGPAVSPVPAGPAAFPAAGPARLIAPGDSRASAEGLAAGRADGDGQIAPAPGPADWVPFEPLVNAQLGLFYHGLFKPISDAVVHDFLDPVLENPLNVAVWLRGAVSALGTTLVTAINFAIAQFNYFFGGLVPPVAPITPAATHPIDIAPPVAAEDLDGGVTRRGIGAATDTLDGPAPSPEPAAGPDAADGQAEDVEKDSGVAPTGAHAGLPDADGAQPAPAAATGPARRLADRIDGTVRDLRERAEQIGAGVRDAVRNALPARPTKSPTDNDSPTKGTPEKAGAAGNAARGDGSADSSGSKAGENR
jgi:hypothetical protein